MSDHPTPLVTRADVIPLAALFFGSLAFYAAVAAAVSSTTGIRLQALAMHLFVNVAVELRQGFAVLALLLSGHDVRVDRVDTRNC